MTDRCMSGPECGLCFSRRKPAALTACRWRDMLGPVTRLDRYSPAEYPDRRWMKNRGEGRPFAPSYLQNCSSSAPP
jgi:hypothetical protein